MHQLTAKRYTLSSYRHQVQTRSLLGILRDGLRLAEACPVRQQLLEDVELRLVEERRDDLLASQVALGSLHRLDVHLAADVDLRHKDALSITLSRVRSEIWMV